MIGSMMQITKLEEIKRGRIQVWLNDEPAFTLRTEDVKAFRLQEGGQLDDQLYRQICDTVLAAQAKERCLKILEAGNRTSYELQSRLEKEGFPAEVARDAVAYAAGFHYVDDYRYALRYIENKGGRKSRMEITMQLRAKGVPDDVMEQAFEDREEGSEEEAVLYWIEKKHFSPETADRDEIRRFTAFLQRKGFSYGAVRNAIEKSLQKSD